MVKEELEIVAESLTVHGARMVKEELEIVAESLWLKNINTS